MRRNLYTIECIKSFFARILKYAYSIVNRCCQNVQTDLVLAQLTGHLEVGSDLVEGGSTVDITHVIPVVLGTTGRTLTLLTFGSYVC